MGVAQQGQVVEDAVRWGTQDAPQGRVTRQAAHCCSGGFPARLFVAQHERAPSEIFCRLERHSEAAGTLREKESNDQVKKGVAARAGKGKAVFGRVQQKLGRYLLIVS